MLKSARLLPLTSDFLEIVRVQTGRRGIAPTQN